MRIIAYVDGFSVYYACFKGPTKLPHAHLKWLDYRALIQAMFPDDEVVAVHVYTAIAPNPPDDPGQSMRHDVYRRALQTIPGVEVHLGRFQKAKREAVLARPPDKLAARQTVYVYQEKQSDVSLASPLLVDASEGLFDRAVLLTNDSDFVTPVELVSQHFRREVYIVSPDKSISGHLRKIASAAWILDRGLLATCQLPAVVINDQGREIRMPERWRKSLNDVE